MTLPPSYNPNLYEDKIYDLWEKSGFFNPDILMQHRQQCSNEAMKKHKTFSIAMPPPNATGELHIGHAMFLTIQDILTRYHRMKGDITLWLPGTDHAAIATQTKVEKNLLKTEKKTRQSLGREQFLKKVDKFVSESQNTIRKQIRKMGSSCDWSRERYTLDEGLTRAVQEAFVRMYHDGLIYRGDRIVNWCPRCESTLADDEVEYKEVEGKLYYIKYKLKTQNLKLKTTTQNLKLTQFRECIMVATTRPETLLGDTAVAVNPKDKRYKNLVGLKLTLPLVLRELTVVADESVDVKFGTGAVKVTPSHDINDFTIAERHKLAKIKILTDDGRLNQNVPAKYQNLDRFKARDLIVNDLKKEGVLEKTEDHKHNVGFCYRCDTVIEPMTSKQWFVDVEKKLKIKSEKLKVIVGKNHASLKEIATAVVKKGEIEIIPARFKKTYFHWMENLRDWCISRQIWFGHRIPVWYCQTKCKVQSAKCKVTTQKLKLNNNVTMKQCNNVVVSIAKPKKCPQCGGSEFTQDPDTLDTWFSSGLWTFSTLGWPEETRQQCNNVTMKHWSNFSDLNRFHPTSVMETGYDILFFWVARMILMTTYFLGEVPFKTVYLHGLVRDKEGRKMSKSLGNGIDPLDMIKKYGADAVRLSLVIGTTPGNDIRLYEEKIAGYRNFVNKIWNISRFVLTQLKQSGNPKSQAPNPKQIPNFKSQISRNNNLTLQSAGQALKQYNNVTMKQCNNETKTAADKWILFELSQLIKKVNSDLKNYRFSHAGEEIYDFLWHKLADWYIEAVKVENQPHQQEILMYVLEKCLILLHPFVPYVTEEIWSMLKSEILMTQPWAEKIDFKISKNDADNFVKIQEIVTAIRNARSDLKIPAGEYVNCKIDAKNTVIIQENQKLIEKLAKIRIVNQENLKSPKIIKIPFANIYLDKTDAPKSVLSGEKENNEVLQKYVEALKKRLADKNFLTKAPAVVVAKEKERLKEALMKMSSSSN